MQITNIALIVLKTITSSTIHIQSAFFNLNIGYNCRDGIIVALNFCSGRILYIGFLNPNPLDSDSSNLGVSIRKPNSY